MTKFKEYVIKIENLTTVLDEWHADNSDTLTVLLNTYVDIYTLYKLSVTDYIHDKITRLQFDIISNGIDRLFTAIKQRIIRYILDKYNKK